jgi:tRNA threonylcarbamoyladenosine modification (KEOPS) complex Cgi121 subunit
MGDEIFPCRRVEFESPCENPRELVNSWIKNRYSEQWALISGIALASEIHAWTAYDLMIRNNERNKMKSNSIDGEFMRLLSGTHHISASFTRAGIIVGEKYGYIVDLSCNASEEDFTSHAAKMNFTILDDRPSLEIFDAKRLGIENGEDENAAIGHVLTSDLR